MRTIFRRLTQSLIISILSVIVLGCSAYAANIDATVPASLPITVSSDGAVTTATNAAIHNYGSSPIFVSSINVTAENGWSLATEDAAASASIGAKVISMGFNGSWMDASGDVDTSGFERISSSDTLNISYDAKIPKVVTAESSSTAATATFVVGLPTVPTMAAGSSWYKSAQGRNTITKITFMDSYTPASYDEKWAADVNGTGDITCYRTGTEIIIAGNGTGKILANANSSYLFSYSSSKPFPGLSSKNRFTKLTSIENLALLDTAKVTNMDSMFHNCTGLTSLDVSGLDTANVTDISGMFIGCSGLTSLDVSNFDTANVTRMDSMFSSCSGLTSLDVSNFDTANVTDMNSMFKGCSALTTIYAGDAWNTDKVTSSNDMFGNCSKLKGAISYDTSKTDATYANWTTGYLTYKGLTATLAAGSSWYKSSENRNTITKITFMDSYTPASYDEKWAADVDGTGDITCYRTGTEILIAGNGAGKIKANADSSFLFSSAGDNRFTKLTSIENLALLDTANVTNISYIFRSCSGLTSLDVSHFDTANVTDMSDMFSSCEGLTSLDVSHFDTANVTDMSDMFSFCSGLTSLDVSHFDTANVTNMSDMFQICSGLTSIDVSRFDTSKVTDMTWMFGGCSGLTTIYAGDAWNTDKVTDSNYMFYYCTNLRGDIAYNGSDHDKTYAKTSGGYLTYKAASTKTLSLNIDPNSGAVTSYDVSTNPISRFRAFLDWSDTANVA